VQGKLRGRLRIEHNIEFEDVTIQPQNRSAAQIAADQADAQDVPGTHLKNLVGMPTPSSRKTHPHRFAIEFFLFDEQTVHSRSPAVHPHRPLLV
jgi:hypothetical protein